MTKSQKNQKGQIKDKQNSEVKVNIRKVAISLLQNETEMDIAIAHVFTFIFTETGLEGDAIPRIEKSLLTGVLGNRIKMHETEIMGKNSSEFIKKLISRLELTDEQIGLHLSQDLIFSIKLDKQEAYQNRLIVTTSGSECVQILAKFIAHGKKELRWEKVLEKLTSLE